MGVQKAAGAMKTAQADAAATGRMTPALTKVGKLFDRGFKENGDSFGLHGKGRPVPPTEGSD